MCADGQHELEHRLRIVEGKLSIYDPIASRPPSANTGVAGCGVSLYREDGEKIVVLADRRRRAEDLNIMLSDGEALEGVEAWLNQQELRINLGSRARGLETDTFVESSAGWLLRLVRNARAALAAPRQAGE